MLVESSGAGSYAEQNNQLIQLAGPESVIGRSLIVHALEDNCEPVEGPLGDLSAGARIALCTIGLDEDSAERQLRRTAIRRRYERAAAADAAALAGQGPDTCAWTDAKLPSTIHPLEYDIVLEPGLDGADGFGGLLSATISVSAPTSCVVMHSSGLNITSVWHTTANRRRQALCTSSALCDAIVTDIGRQMISITLGYMTSPGSTFTLMLEFTGRYRSRGSGLYLSAPSPRTPPLVVTQFEATGARWAFPCFDEPALKAEVSVQLIVPQRGGLAALTNMPETGRSPERGRPGFERVSFAKSPPMSTYLIAFTIGELTRVSSTVAGRGGPEVNVWSVPELAPNLGEAASVAAASLAFYHHLTGVPFSLPKADMVAVPGKGGAMENWGLLLFDERRFLVNPSTEGEYHKQECRNVICHEVAHQWFGDLVTDADWDSLWMNEGFASFFEYLCMDGVQENTFSHIADLGATVGPWPRTTYGSVDVYSVAYTPNGEGVGVHEGPHQHALRTESSASAHPLYAQGERVGGDLVYSKGSATLWMIYDYMERVAPGSFMRGTNDYLNTHAYSTVVSDDFWLAIGNACDPSIAAGCAGIEAGMAGAWTRSGGFPILSITSADSGGISLQQRPVNPGNPSSQGATWWLPLTIGDSMGGVGVANCPAENCHGEGDHFHCHGAPQYAASCNVPLPDGLTPPLVVNPTAAGLFRVECKLVILSRFACCPSR